MHWSIGHGSKNAEEKASTDTPMVKKIEGPEYTTILMHNS